MATLERKDAPNIEGTAETLELLMVEAQRRNARMKVKNAQRYAEAIVRAAIRRDGHTYAHQRLILSDSERAAWLARNPLDD
jgi:hypothetical protein